MGRCASGGFCWGLVLGLGFWVCLRRWVVCGCLCGHPRIVSALHALPFGVFSL
ncbi:hypothetical protein J2802_000018 [Paraburkholderia caribensis]|nr:hypothetical protein [Paraburkholderia caribensis]